MQGDIIEGLELFRFLSKIIELGSLCFFVVCSGFWIPIFVCLFQNQRKNIVQSFI